MARLNVERHGKCFKSKYRSCGFSSKVNPEQTQGAKPKSSWGFVLGGLATAVGLAGIGLYWYQTQTEKVEEPVPIPVPPMPEAYVHPYTRWPWYKRYWFVFCRTTFLLYLWIPCFGMTAYTALRGKLKDPAWVDWLLARVVATLEQSGAGFMKFGQWVAMRPDLFPQSLCRAMAKLQDNSPSHTYDETRKTIRESFGMEIEEIFSSFDPNPVASGSVGQVHKAELKEKYALPNGQRNVAVKVRHPNVLDSSYADIWLIFWVMRSSPSLGLQICLPFKEHEFYNNIQKQVDFTWEAYNLLKFNANFHGEDDPENKVRVVFPVVHQKMLTEAVLIESWAPGENLATMLKKKTARSKVWDEHLASEFKTEDASAAPVETEEELSPQEKSLRKDLALRCCDIAAKMFLRDNYIHGDLHAGNLLYSAKDNLLTVVDAGLTTFLESDSFVPFGDFLRALCSGDADVTCEKLVEFNVNQHFKESSVPAFRADVSAIFDKYMGVDRSRQEDQLVMGYIMGEVLNTIGKYSITLKGDVSSSLMTISISEGLVLSLDPEFDLVGRTLPYFVRYAGWSSLAAIRQGGYYSTKAKARDLISGTS